MAPVIAFDAVRHAFAGTDGTPITALDGVSFDVGRHEFLSILGPSGCGKSTLLRLIGRPDRAERRHAPASTASR